MPANIEEGFFNSKIGLFYILVVIHTVSVFSLIYMLQFVAAKPECLHFPRQTIIVCIMLAS